MQYLYEVFVILSIPVFITEEDLLEFIDELKEYTGEGMKIDTAPWIWPSKEVNMDNLYTELKLEKLENDVASI